MAMNPNVLVITNEDPGPIKEIEGVRIIAEPPARMPSGDWKIFCLSRLSMLAEAVNKIRHLAPSRDIIWLLARDVPAELFPLLAHRASLRSLRNVLVYTRPDVPVRVLTGWSLGAEDELIATAAVIEDRLLVRSCSLRIFDVGFEDLPALKAIPKDDRSTFQISSDGSYIVWPELDVHLDIDAIRNAMDPSWREHNRMELFRHNRRIGQAIRVLRESRGLKQKEIRRLSERQVRRIEHGEDAPRMSSLKALSKAHRMSLEDYLDALAEKMAD